MSTETSTDTTTSEAPPDADPAEPQQDPADDQATGPNGAVEPDDAEESPEGPGDSDDGKQDREAARYRRQLRAAEAERDALRSQVEGYHRAEVERLAGARGLIDPLDVWASGVSLDQMLTDAGAVDTARVEKVVADIAQSRPHWVRSAAAPASAVTSAGKPGHSDSDATTTWKGVFDRTLHGSDAD